MTIDRPFPGEVRVQAGRFQFIFWRLGRDVRLVRKPGLLNGCWIGPLSVWWTAK